MQKVNRKAELKIWKTHLNSQQDKSKKIRN